MDLQTANVKLHRPEGMGRQSIIANSLKMTH